MNHGADASDVMAGSLRPGVRHVSESEVHLATPLIDLLPQVDTTPVNDSSGIVGGPDTTGRLGDSGLAVGSFSTRDLGIDPALVTRLDEGAVGAVLDDLGGKVASLLETDSLGDLLPDLALAWS